MFAENQAASHVNRRYARKYAMLQYLQLCITTQTSTKRILIPSSFTIHNSCMHTRRNADNGASVRRRSSGLSTINHRISLPPPRISSHPRMWLYLFHFISFHFISFHFNLFIHGYPVNRKTAFQGAVLKI